MSRPRHTDDLDAIAYVPAAPDWRVRHVFHDERDEPIYDAIAAWAVFRDEGGHRSMLPLIADDHGTSLRPVSDVVESNDYVIVPPGDS